MVLYKCVVDLVQQPLEVPHFFFAQNGVHATCMQSSTCLTDCRANLENPCQERQIHIEPARD